MSTVLQASPTAIATPASSKKRKNDTEVSGKAKKKRKQTQSQEETSLSQSSVKDGRKRDKRKRKEEQREKEAVTTEVEAIQDTETQDIELPDVPTSQTLVHETPIQDLDLEEELSYDLVEEIDDTLLESTEPTSFYTKRMSLYVPIPAISLASPTSSLLSLHLSSLLLKYFPPVGGVVVSFSDPVLSARPEVGLNLPLRPPTSGRIPKHPPDETFAQCADQFGVCWVWLTVSFLVFAPEQGDELKAWTNVQSESFIGLVSYNYFQTSVSKERIPKSWTFDGPTYEQKKKKVRKGKLRDEDDELTNGDVVSSQASVGANEAENSGGDGVFVDEDGSQINSTQKIRVAGVEVVPGAERETFGMQLEGSLLSPEEENVLLAEEKRQFEAVQRRQSRAQTPAEDDSDLPLMSGALSTRRTGSVL